MVRAARPGLRPAGGPLARLVDRLTPPERLRVGPFREGAFRSRLHDERLAAILGLALGVAFTVCFATGMLSHLIQHPPSWFRWPPRPAGLYRITQGVHVATGIASIPLLLAKLWVVYPRLWTWPPVRSVAHALERASLLPLVGGSVFLLFGGVFSIVRFYPWPFSFPAAHYHAAWITVGALVIHVGAKAGVARSALARPEHEETDRRPIDPDPEPADAYREPIDGGLTRRRFLGAVGAAAGALTLATLGQTVRPLGRLSVLAPRHPSVGPQSFPVNKTAASARVEEAATDPGYRLVVEGRVPRPLSLSLDDLRSMFQHEARLPIACVDGWSASAWWRGVPVRDLLDLAGAPPDAEVLVRSLQPRGPYRESVLNPLHARDGDTLLAMEIDGEPLHIDHGFPVRLIGPNRPGVMQTKWVGRLVVR